MPAKNIQKLIKSVKPLQLVALIFGLGILVILGVVFAQRIGRRSQATIAPNQIKIQKGDKTVIIDENGLVEYRTSDGVFYEAWDSSRIQEFFASMREKARLALNNPPPEEGAQGYWVTIWIDGEEVTVFIEEDEELDEIFEEFDEDNGSLGEYFDDFFDDDNGDTQDGDEDITSTPIPTPTPTGYVGQPSDEELGLFDCSLFEYQVTGRTVISNTLCIEKQQD